MTTLSGGNSGGGGGPANTDAVTEGNSNLYFTSNRAIKSFINSSTNIIQTITNPEMLFNLTFNGFHGGVLEDTLNYITGNTNGSYNGTNLEVNGSTTLWETDPALLNSISTFTIAFWSELNNAPPAYKDLLFLGDETQPFPIGTGLYLQINSGTCDLYISDGSTFSFMQVASGMSSAQKWLTTISYRRNGGSNDNDLRLRMSQDGTTWFETTINNAVLMQLSSIFKLRSTKTLGTGSDIKYYNLTFYKDYLSIFNIQELFDQGFEGTGLLSGGTINDINNSCFQKHSFIATDPLTPSTAPVASNYGIALGDGAISNGGIAIGQNSVADGGFAFGESYSNGGVAINIGNNANTFGAVGSNTIALGSQNRSLGNNSVTIGIDNETSAQEAVAIGRSNISNGIGATALGYYTKTDSSYSTAIGFESVARLDGTVAQASGKFAVAGDVQKINAFLKQETSNGFLNQLYLLNNAGDLVIQDNSTWGFKGLITGRDNSGNTALWEISGAVKRGSGIATVTLVGTPTVTLLAQDAGAGGWGGPAINVDTLTFGSLLINVTGQTGVNIRWSCDLSISEILF